VVGFARFLEHCDYDLPPSIEATLNLGCV
jgi:hypothetical protein